MSENREAERVASVERKTRESDVSIEINLDGSGDYAVATGIPFFDHMLESFAKHGLLDLRLRAKGDLAVDLHHTVEDVGIVLGRALREALDSGQLALASLDTVTPEPLPEGHWLYDHPGVRLSPHVSWSMPGAMDGLVDPFIENLGRWQEGRPLIDPVDVDEGY